MTDWLLKNALPSLEGRFSFYAWLDGCAVFDRLNGDTHLLDSMTAQQFLVAIKVSPADLGRLHLPDLSEDALSVARLDARIRLERLNLPF